MRLIIFISSIINEYWHTIGNVCQFTSLVYMTHMYYIKSLNTANINCSTKTHKHMHTWKIDGLGLLQLLLF